MILNKLVGKMIGIFTGVTLVTAGLTPFTPSAFATTSVPPVAQVAGQQWVQVSTAAQLEYIDQNPTADITSGSTTTYLNANIELMTSIDLSGYAWNPLGSSSGSIGGYAGNPLGSLIPGPFSGTFNGNGYEVTNVSVSRTLYYVGFFGYSSGTVENMGVEGTISANIGASGVLVGKDVGSITNCYTTGSISSTSGGEVGGLVGVQAAGSITNSYSTVYVYGGGQTLRVGGLVGQLVSATVSNSYSLGQVLDSRSNIYGIPFVGGLIGLNQGTVSDSYYDEGTSGQSGGIGAQSDNAMKQQSTYTNWNFKNTWGARGPYPYPSLMSQKYKINFPVFYNSNGGSTVSDEIVVYGQVAIQPTQPTMTGSTFVGWYSDSGLTTPFDFSTPITSVTTLYAKWNCMVTFDSNGGTTVSSETVGYGTDATQPTDPTKTGYVFKGWYSDSGLTTPSSFSTAIKGNATLYAKWALPAPTLLTTSGTSSTQTTLSWNAVTGATSYDVYEEGSLIATGVTGTSYTVNDLTPGDLYRFTISAVNAIGGESAQSNAVSVNMEKIGSVDLTSSSADVLSGSSVTVSGVVYDVYHSPVSNAIVDLSSPTGFWSIGGSSSKTVTADVYGAFTTKWTAPSVTSETNTTVTASVVETVYGAVSNVTPATLSLNVAPPPTISTTTLSGGTAGNSYSQTLDVAGGFAPYSWTVSKDSLPSGLTLISSTGVISGTPTVTGTFDFTVQVKDTAGNTATQALSITVNKPSSPSGSGGSSNSGGTSTPSNNGSTSTPSNNGEFSSAWQRSVNVTSGTLTTVNVQGSDVSVQSVGTPISGNAVEITTQTLDTIPQITTNLPVTANVTSALGVHYTGTRFPVKVTVSNPLIQIGTAIDEWVNGTLKQVPATVVNGQVSLQISSNTDLVVVTPKPMVLYPNVREMVWNGQTYGYQSMVKKDPNTGKNTTYMPIWYVMQVLNQAGIYSTWNGHTWSMTSSNPSAVSSSSGNTLSQRGDMTITLNGQMSEQVPGIVGEDMIHGNKTTFMPIWYVMQILKQAGVHSDWTGSMWAMYPIEPPTTQQ